jgi:hypothetical protein
MVTKKRNRTTEDVLKEQEKQAEAERGNTAMVKAASNALAADESNPWLEMSTELDRILGLPRMKFSKEGQYTIGEDEIIPLGTRVIAHADEMELGWTQWENNRPVDRRWGCIADKFVPPLESDLPDNEPRLQPDGSRRKPWQFGMAVPITRLDAGGETYAFDTTSRGGLGALSGLSRAYGKRIKQAPGLPIVELKGDRYWHRVHHSWVHYPIFLIVGWTGPDGKPLSVAEEMNDEIGI